MANNKIEQASAIMGTENYGGLIGKTMPGFGNRKWEDLTTKPFGELVVEYYGGCNIYRAERRSDGTYQVEGRNWCAMFDATEECVVDLGPREFAAYGGVNGNVPSFINELIADFRKKMEA